VRCRGREGGGGVSDDRLLVSIGWGEGAGTLPFGPPIAVEAQGPGCDVNDALLTVPRQERGHQREGARPREHAPGHRQLRDVPLLVRGKNQLLPRAGLGSEYHPASHRPSTHRSQPAKPHRGWGASHASRMMIAARVLPRRSGGTRRRTSTRSGRWALGRRIWAETPSASSPTSSSSRRPAPSCSSQRSRRRWGGGEKYARARWSGLGGGSSRVDMLHHIMCHHDASCIWGASATACM
jgi:hypothetical protein